MSFDAKSLRNECRSFYNAAPELPVVVFGEAMPGEYPTQRGSFEISSDTTTISVCVWEKGRVEIFSLGNGGAVQEIETLEKSGLAEAAIRIGKHIAKYV